MSQSNGELVAYWEQGWEGRIDFAFQSDDANQPIFLKNGHTLTIYDEAETVLWSGKIKWVRVRVWDRYQNKKTIWSYEKQKGVSYGQWLAWFWREIPLKARLASDNEG
jgi:hypothetical protein